MDKLIEDIFYMGVGIASLTEKKVEETVRELVKNGLISKKQAEKLVKTIMNETKQIRSTLVKEGKKKSKKMANNAIDIGKKAVSKGTKEILKLSKKIGKI